MRLLFLLSVLLVSRVGAWSLSEPVDEGSKKAWEQVDPSKRAEIKAKLLRFGLSSTGAIKLQKIYKQGQKSNLGKAGESVAMFIQEDLFGERLFWVVVVNLETKAVRVLYDINDRQSVNEGSVKNAEPASDSQIQKKSMSESK